MNTDMNQCMCCLCGVVEYCPMLRCEMHLCVECKAETADERLDRRTL